MGVRTENCCCGHGKEGSILINASDQKKAEQLGYNPKIYYLADGTYTGLCEMKPQMAVMFTKGLSKEVQNIVMEARI
jgi:hypothetical protein